MKQLFLALSIVCGIANAQVWVVPSVTGNGESDSVIASFCTFDTTLYPVIADADSIVALRYGPDNSLLDSLTSASVNVHRIRSGWYEIHCRASNALGALGLYRIYVRIKIGGDWRGAASASYQVIGDDVGDYFAMLAASAGQAGTGAYACTLRVCEIGSSTAVVGVSVRVMNSDESATAALGISDANGRLLCALDDREYHVFAGLSGYNAVDLPLVIDVSPSGVADTIWVERFDPGVPADASLCRVYGYISSLDGRGIPGVAVTARIQKSPLLLDGTVVSPFAITSSTDSNGYWYLDLIPNGMLDPDDTKYDFTVHYPSGTIMRKQVEVPSSASYWLRW